MCYILNSTYGILLKIVFWSNLRHVVRDLMLEIEQGRLTIKHSFCHSTVHEGYQIRQEITYLPEVAYTHGSVWWTHENPEASLCTVARPVLYGNLVKSS